MIGDAVNLGSRLEDLFKAYGVEIGASEDTRKLASHFVWQELDRVRVKGKAQAVGIFTPVAASEQLAAPLQQKLRAWGAFLAADRAGLERVRRALRDLQRMNAKKYLYDPYSERVASMRLLPFAPSFDGATNFDTK